MEAKLSAVDDVIEVFGNTVVPLLVETPASALFYSSPTAIQGT